METSSPSLGALDARAVEALRRAVPGVYAIYRFGSTVTGGTHRESDIDLAFLAPRPLEPLRRWNLQEEIAAALSRQVDLVDLRSASTVLRMQVITHGELLWSSDDLERQRFEMYVYSSYARLNEERREILEQVRREGTVLGL